jgi:hypothetical protein
MKAAQNRPTFLIVPLWLSKSRLEIGQFHLYIWDVVFLRHKLGEPTNLFQGVQIAFPVQVSPVVGEAGKSAEDTHLRKVGSLT